MTTRLACDVLVVGGGSGGSVVAGRLAAESDARVTLVEAGPDYGARTSGLWPADLLDGGALVTSHEWGYDSGPIAGREPIAFQRARVIGGCSSHNGCVVAVGCPEDYDRWAALTGDARWSAVSVRPALARALERMRVRTYAESEVGPFHRACLDAAASLGVVRADDLDDLDGGIGFGIEPVNIEEGVRFNASFAYVDPARGRDNLTILDRAICDRVIVKGRRVEVTVLRGGEELRIAAGTVVLAAGAYGTPAILQRSGVGDPALLHGAGIEPLVDLPGVGRNLHDHPLAEVEFASSEQLKRLLAESAAIRFTPEEQTLGKLRSSRASGPYDLHVFPVAAHEHSLLAGRVALAVSAMEPLSRGSLHVTGVDPEDVPRIDHGYLSDPGGADLAVIDEGIAWARELAAAESLRELIGPEITPSLDRPVSEYHAHYFHPVGTCAMGVESDPFAVCDGAGHVRGLESVLVADCSLMPVIPRANTNLPAVLVGELITDAILG
ncbi:MAG: GMC family oxidoreductase N-terminal domain-containing protein [Thermoleophilia bacterium]|nr:GMC family oxidoreductase N-terminal domain-containing protein [Thermoleophilia bacterium]